MNIYIKQKDLKTHLQSFHGGSHQTMFSFSLKIYIPLNKHHIIIFSQRVLKSNVHLAIELEKQILSSLFD